MKKSRDGSKFSINFNQDFSYVEHLLLHLYHIYYTPNQTKYYTSNKSAKRKKNGCKQNRKKFETKI